MNLSRLQGSLSRSGAGPAPRAARDRSDGWLLRGSLLGGGMLVVMANASLSPALPQLRAAFPAAADLQIRLILTLPALVIVVASPLAGWTADRFGRKPLLIFSALLYGLAGGSGYLAPDIHLLLAGRALLGVAMAGMMTCLSTLVVDYFSGEARARFMGLQAAFSGLGGAFFLVLAGVLADAGWQQPFLMYLVALPLLPLLITSLHEPERAAPQRGAESLPAITAPLWRLVLFACLMVGLNQAVFNLVPLQLPFLLRERLGATSAENGLMIGVLALFFSLGALIYGRIGTRVAHIPLAGAALALMGASFVLIALATDSAPVYAAMVICGLSLGLFMPNIQLMLANGAPPALRGRLMGSYSAALYLGQFVSPLALAATGAAIATVATWLKVGVATLLIGALLACLRKPLRRLLHAESPPPHPSSRRGQAGAV